MKKEFKMSQEEMDNIIAINKGGGDPVMFLSGGIPMGQSLQEKINQYWGILGDKYGFKPLTAEGNPKGNLYFFAEAIEEPTAGSFKKNTPDSSSVESMEYNAETKAFTITFKRGGIYDYANVTPKDAYRAQHSPSAGAIPRNELSAYNGVKRG